MAIFKVNFVHVNKKTDVIVFGATIAASAARLKTGEAPQVLVREIGTIETLVLGPKVSPQKLGLSADMSVKL